MAMTKKNLQHAGMGHNRDGGQTTAAWQPRLDMRSENIVERGIVMQAHYNTVCALEYLKSRNVGADIIERVLLHPQLRRKTGC
jgi:hypothetical protein